MGFIVGVVYYMGKYKLKGMNSFNQVEWYNDGQRGNPGARTTTSTYAASSSNDMT